jgi:hypothetical protein
MARKKKAGNETKEQSKWRERLNAVVGVIGIVIALMLSLLGR